MEKIELGVETNHVWRNSLLSFLFSLVGPIIIIFGVFIFSESLSGLGGAPRPQWFIPVMHSFFTIAPFLSLILGIFAVIFGLQAWKIKEKNAKVNSLIIIGLLLGLLDMIFPLVVLFIAWRSIVSLWG